MSKTIRSSGDYSIIANPGNNINLDADAILINADLVVTGTTTTIDTVDLIITDNIIQLNDGEAGPGVTAGTAGIEIDRGDGVSAGEESAFLLWDEAIDKFVVNYGAGGPNLEVVAVTIGEVVMLDLIDDLTPQLGGDLDVNGNSITALINLDVTISVTGTGTIILDGPAIITGADPVTPPAAGDVAVFQAADTGGGSQIHYRNDTETGELISKAKAIAFSIIF